MCNCYDNKICTMLMKIASRVNKTGAFYFTFYIIFTIYHGLFTEFRLHLDLRYDLLNEHLIDFFI